LKTVKVGVFKTGEGLNQALKSALNAAEWNKHVRGKVFLKPNLCAVEYIPGAVTNPEVLFHLVSLLRDRVAEVTVGESDGYNYSCDEALMKTGVAQMVEKAGGKTINLSKDETVKVQNPNALFMKKTLLPKTLVEADSILSVPVMKTHEFTLFTGAIKNLFGCIPNNRRIYLHPHINMVLYDLITILKPKLAVMDATTAMEGNGPNRGIPVPMELVLASNDLLTFDKISAEIMGINWKDVGYLSFIDKNLQQEVATQIIGERIDSLKRQFVRPYLDLAVKAQLWVYQSYLLTRLCFGTPLFDALQACLKVYRKINKEIKGKTWAEKYWQNSDELLIS
jgi:uncharacterized protein (DUF362 family)